ncbi:Cof-type HAD-IIB family hydrolase [Staphylococcus auricularis]|uniref:Cof-type HAD-IIB family hydrolase n=1 Tax=Staphylococcus auricularis TaxID=29379 RepID=UPI00242BF052|nr:Cof-type HAD-IIB family hydrolase [Staphylococcus auricularis]
MIKAIATDMDGTFLTDEKTFDQPRFERIFQQLKEQNIAFIAASGNQYAKLHSIFGEREMYFVGENGAVLYHGGERIDYHAFDQAIYRDVIDYLVKAREYKEIIVCGLNSAYILKDTPQAFKENVHFYYRQLEEVESFEPLPEDEFVKIAFNVNRETHPTLDEDIAKRFEDEIKLVSSGHDSIDVIQPGVTKGFALQRLLQKLGLTADELMTFGDANNDLDMLQLTPHSYAMGNAKDEDVFEAAQHVAPSNNDQGVLHIIDEVVLNSAH